MRAKNSNEFDVYCRNCEKVSVVEGPEDLVKITTSDKNTRLATKCYYCGKRIEFDSVFGYSLRPEFLEQVKFEK